MFYYKIIGYHPSLTPYPGNLLSEDLVKMFDAAGLGYYSSSLLLIKKLS